VHLVGTSKAPQWWRIKKLSIAENDATIFFFITKGIGKNPLMKLSSSVKSCGYLIIANPNINQLIHHNNRAKRLTMNMLRGNSAELT